MHVYGQVCRRGAGTSEPKLGAAASEDLPCFAGVEHDQVEAVSSPSITGPKHRRSGLAAPQRPGYGRRCWIALWGGRRLSAVELRAPRVLTFARDLAGGDVARLEVVSVYPGRPWEVELGMVIGRPARRVSAEALCPLPNRRASLT